MLELEGNPMFGREHPFSLDSDVVKYFHLTKQPRDSVDSDQKSHLPSGNKASLEEHEIRKNEKQKQVKEEENQQFIQARNSKLDQDDAEIGKQKYAAKKLEEDFQLLQELDREEKKFQEEKCLEVDLLTSNYDAHGPELASLDAFFGDREAQGTQELIQERQLKLQGKLRSIDDENHKFGGNKVEYLKGKGIYQLTSPGLDKVPFGKPIPINELERYDPVFKDNAVIKQNLEVGNDIPKVIVQKYEASFSVEIPNLGGEIIIITCCGSDRNEALKKVVAEMKKVLLGFEDGNS
jgi:hypothetical protein